MVYWTASEGYSREHPGQHRCTIPYLARYVPPQSGKNRGWIRVLDLRLKPGSPESGNTFWRSLTLNGRSKNWLKKFPSLKNDFAQLLESLQEEPTQGTPLGNNCYKIRMAISSKGKGKSGGSRVITHLKVSHTAIYLLSIYDKSDQENIPDSIELPYSPRDSCPMYFLFTFVPLFKKEGTGWTLGVGYCS